MVCSRVTSQSFAYAGLAVVAFAAIAAIVVLPAAIALLGDGWIHGTPVGCSAIS